MVQQLICFFDKTRFVADNDGSEQILLGREMPVNSADAYTGTPGNFIHRDGAAFGRKNLMGNLEKLISISYCICTQCLHGRRDDDGFSSATVSS
ncbi:hypothetical protein D3C75_1273090 [compost metagenome]